jgi:hypothetical protein
MPAYWPGAAPSGARPPGIGEVDGAQAGEHPLHATGQRVIRRVQIGEQRVAAERGQFLGVEYRRHHRFGQEHLVGMPAAAEVARIPFRLDDLGDFGPFRQAGDMGMQVNFPEPPREGELLVGRDRLVREEDRAMRQQRLFNLGERGLVQGFRKIDPGNLRAQGAGDPRCLKWHSPTYLFVT